jgi:hypothetical protein
LELDLNCPGNVSDKKVLFLTGWVFPTCTSLNLAMAENPLKPDQQPPAIEVPDASGNWIRVIPYAGFPGGKTKTIAIDLTGKFLCDDHRLRVVSNMELCWDEAFFTVEQPQLSADNLRVRRLPLKNADLHFRGFSDQRLQPGNAPIYYDYNSVSTASIWPPINGSFTRYGDVLPLLVEADDMQVVMGAGDELTLTFDAGSDQPPEGWVRDFMIYNVGWDKDADLNTILGQNVGPLPFRAMRQYPYFDQQFPDTPDHHNFLRQYQTRQQDVGLFWNQIRDFQ